MATKTLPLTQERLKEALSYDADTGVWVWIKQQGHMRAGMRAGCVTDAATGHVSIRIDGCLYPARHLAWFYTKGEWPSEVQWPPDIWKSEELAYLAGLIDGEGNLSAYCSNSKAKGRSYMHIRLCMKVYNSDLEMLNWIKQRFGGVIYEVGKDRPANWKRGFAWQIGHQRAATILRRCLSFLVSKRRQAVLS